jgi:hypothetical protein
MIRSAYHLEKEKKELRHEEGSKSSRCSKLWKTCIWSLRVPNPVTIFLWLACNDILPTKENLQKRDIIKDCFCIFCNRECESALHILWNCPLASDL